MRERLRLHAERARASVFFVPAVFLLLAITAAVAMLQVGNIVHRLTDETTQCIREQSLPGDLARIHALGERLGFRSSEAQTQPGV